MTIDHRKDQGTNLYRVSRSDRYKSKCRNGFSHDQQEYKSVEKDHWNVELNNVSEVEWRDKKDDGLDYIERKVQ